MWGQDAWDFAVRILRAIKTARDEEAWRTLEVHFLHRVLVAVDLTVDHGIQRRLGGHRPQTGRHQNLPPHLLLPLGPITERRRRTKREVTVQVFGRQESSIVRLGLGLRSFWSWGNRSCCNRVRRIGGLEE